jgi:hypothetical protein
MRGDMLSREGCRGALRLVLPICVAPDRRHGVPIAPLTNASI